MLELAPEGIPVFYIIVEFQEYDQHAVLALGVGLLLVYFLVSEDEILQRFCHPFFHLIGCGTGIYGNAGTLADGELRHFLLRHDADAQNAHENEHTHEEHHDIMVAHRRFDERTLDDAVGFSRNASLDMVVKSGVLLRNLRLVCLLIFVLIHIFSLHILSVVTLSGIHLHTF